jgi:DNA-binding NarL/FixJ family response regulator
LGANGPQEVRRYPTAARRSPPSRRDRHGRPNAELDGIAATETITPEQPEVHVLILILTTFDLDEYAFAGLRAGASGFLLKNAPRDGLVAAIRTVAAGDAVVSPRVTRRLLDTFAQHMPTATRV